MGNDLQKYVARYRKDGSAQPLVDHLVGCAKLSRQFAGKIGLPSMGEAGGLLHDDGKFRTLYQKYIRSAAGVIKPGEDGYLDPEKNRGKVDHSTSGAQYLWNQMDVKKSPIGSLAAQIVSLCATSHHGGLINCLDESGADAFGARLAKPDCETGAVESIERVPLYIRQRIRSLMDDEVAGTELTQCVKTLLSGDTSLVVQWCKVGLLTRFILSCLIDADCLDAAGWRFRQKSSWAELLDVFESHISSFSIKKPIDEIRRQISEDCMAAAVNGRGLYLLTVPTGGGKTFASLRYALHHAKIHNADRIIYVVPYTSIIDQNANSVRKIFQGYDDRAVLEHHSNILPERDTDLNRILSENWDAPIIYTTLVHFLDSLYGSGTRNARRMHQLANSVIIFDEVQTLPIKTVHLFNNAINFLIDGCKSTVVFCTATQPVLDRVEPTLGAAKLSSSPALVADAQSHFDKLRRVNVFDYRKNVGWTSKEVALQIGKELKLSKSVLTIVNTKKQARKLYRLCRNSTQYVYHLSTSMCPAHRTYVLERIKGHLSSKEPVICISTQLIEAGVDVDFGTVVRSLAGLDSICQAAGRCNRNGERENGRVLIVNMTDEHLGDLPEIVIAQQVSARILDEYKENPDFFGCDIIGLASMNRYYDYYFFQRKHEMSYPVSFQNTGKTDLLSLFSTNKKSEAIYINTNKAEPDYKIRQAFKTAAENFKVIDSIAVGVVVPYGPEGENIIAQLDSSTGTPDEIRGLLRLAQRFSVNMYPPEIEKLLEKGRIRKIFEDVLCLDPRNYSDDYGVCVEDII